MEVEAAARGGREEDERGEDDGRAAGLPRGGGGRGGGEDGGFIEGGRHDRPSSRRVPPRRRHKRPRCAAPAVGSPLRLSVFRQAGCRRADYDPGVSEPLPSGEPGTALARAPGVTTSRYQAIRAVHSRATANEWVQLRPPRTAPSILVVSPLLFAAGFPRERILVVLAVSGAHLRRRALAGRALAARRDRAARALRLAPDPRGRPVAHRGAHRRPHEPPLAGIIGATLGTFYVFGRGRESTIAGVVAAFLIVALALLPPGIAGPVIARPYHVALAAWSLLFTLFILRKRLRPAHRRQRSHRRGARQGAGGRDRRPPPGGSGASSASARSRPRAQEPALRGEGARAAPRPGRPRRAHARAAPGHRRRCVADGDHPARLPELLAPARRSPAGAGGDRAIADDVLAVLEARARRRA